MWRTDSLEKTLMLGKIEGRRRRGRQRIRRANGIIDSMDMSLSKLGELVMNREGWCAAVRGVTKNWTKLSDWTATCVCVCVCVCVYKNTNNYVFKYILKFKWLPVFSLSRLLQVSTSMTWSSLEINDNKSLFARHFMLSIQHGLSSQPSQLLCVVSGSVYSFTDKETENRPRF